VIKTLDRKAVEIEMPCHSARFRAGLKHVDGMSRLGCMIASRESHRARAYHHHTSQSFLQLEKYGILLLCNNMLWNCADQASPFGGGIAKK
jgi:hypothetical protein